MLDHKPRIASSSDLTPTKGIRRIRKLPDPVLGALWDSIILDEKQKDRLLSQAILNFTLREKVSRTVLPQHGVILLVGPPGTGKTSLAKGLADRTAATFDGASFQFLEVEPHALTSSNMGKTQRAVSDLFEKSISEAAEIGPTIVLLDEVETLAADRSKMSLEANPIDVHRATDAVLVQLDELAEQYPRLLFLATSNFPKAIDSAFTSRCDLVLHVPLPDKEACVRILNDCLIGLAKTYPTIGTLTTSTKFGQAVDECAGLDGRAIRKVVANALASRRDVAINPNAVTITDLIDAARAARTSRSVEQGDSK